MVLGLTKPTEVLINSQAKLAMRIQDALAKGDEKMTILLDSISDLSQQMGLTASTLAEAITQTRQETFVAVTFISQTLVGCVLSQSLYSVYKKREIEISRQIALTSFCLTLTMRWIAPDLSAPAYAACNVLSSIALVELTKK